MDNFYQNKKVLVTGHTGFKGAWLAWILAKKGAKVIGLSLEPPTTPNLFSLLNLRDCVCHNISDIRDRARVRRLLLNSEPDIVFHLAANAIVWDCYNDPFDAFSTNVLGTLNLLEEIRLSNNKPRAVVVVTTDKVYQNNDEKYVFVEDDKLGGGDPYAASKAATDILAQSYIKSYFSPDTYSSSHETLVSIVRAGNVIGGGDWAAHRLLPDVVRSICGQCEAVVLRNPDNIRPWQHVFEPLFGYMLLAKNLYEGNVCTSGSWNFGPDLKSCITVRDLVERFIKLLGNGAYNVVPNQTIQEASFLYLENSKAKTKLGWQPILGIDETIRLTVDWYNAFYSKNPNLVRISSNQLDYFETLWFKRG